MSFALFSLTAVTIGIAALAFGLWIAQRLRVEHREVEVLSTLFWQQALEETRARVFVRRFRHFWAWVLLVLIASLLWILLAMPQTHSLDGTRHIVLVDGSVADDEVRGGDLALAIDAAGGFPTQDREIIAVGTTLETLLKPGEPIQIATLRGNAEPVPAPADLSWAVEALATRATDQAPLCIHIVGDAPIDQARLDAIAQASSQAGTDRIKILRIDREPIEPSSDLATLGIAESMEGRWNRVDLWIAPPAESGQYAEAELAIARNGSPIDSPLVQRDDGVFELRSLPADGATIEVSLSDRLVGTVKLPLRGAIRVQLESEVPETLRQLIELDNACEIVDTEPDVVVGTSAKADFRLSSDNEPAFAITTEDPNPQDALDELVDRLALEQIDATGIAETSGRVVDVQVASGDRRSIALWSTLFSSAFDFRESRACPVLVTRSIRWLANRPALIPWVELGQRLPESSPVYSRVIESTTVSQDGQTVLASRLAPAITRRANLAESSSVSFLTRINPLTWIGLLIAGLLIGEWVLYQRGQIP